jgi:hypothetical protein
MQGARWDAQNDAGQSVMDGLQGAAAMALQGVDYNSSDNDLVAHEYMAGTVVRHRRENPPPSLEMLMLGIVLDSAKHGR